MSQIRQSMPSSEEATKGKSVSFMQRTNRNTDNSSKYLGRTKGSKQRYLIWCNKYENQGTITAVFRQSEWSKFLGAYKLKKKRRFMYIETLTKHKCKFWNESMGKLDSLYRQIGISKWNYFYWKKKLSWALTHLIL